MRNALAEHENEGVDLMMAERLCDLEYADDLACLSDTAESAQLILGRLAKAVILFGRYNDPPHLGGHYLG